MYNVTLGDCLSIDSQGTDYFVQNIDFIDFSAL